MTDTTTTGPARTVDEMRQTVPVHYGISVSYIGEDGDMLALGHHEPRRVVAALNKLARWECGLSNFVDDEYVSYRDVADELWKAHARLITDCGATTNPGHDPGCQRCAVIRDQNWTVDLSATPGPNTFPVTIWNT